VGGRSKIGTEEEKREAEQRKQAKEGTLRDTKYER
jgi:hypothetical protein